MAPVEVCNLLADFGRRIVVPTISILALCLITGITTVSILFPV